MLAGKLGFITCNRNTYLFSGIHGAGRACVRGIEYYYMDRVIIRCCGDIQGDPGFQIKKADLFHSIKNDTTMAD